MDGMNLNETKMVLHDYSVGSDTITVSRKDLEEWVHKYQKIGYDEQEFGCPTWRSWFYWGKREVLVDLLKQIENNN